MKSALVAVHRRLTKPPLVAKASRTSQRAFDDSLWSSAQFQQRYSVPRAGCTLAQLIVERQSVGIDCVTEVIRGEGTL